MAGGATTTGAVPGSSRRTQIVLKADKRVKKTLKKASKNKLKPPKPKTKKAAGNKLFSKENNAFPKWILEIQLI